MIRIHSLLIEDLRGIRKLQLDFQGQNFAICGPNGAGKSGVVDAIEFAITGWITRLTGQGTSAISLKTHGPQVGYRDEPGKARVTLNRQSARKSECRHIRTRQDSGDLVYLYLVK